MKHLDRKTLMAAAFYAAMSLSGCATYRPDPLPTQSDLADGLAGLVIPTSTISLPELRGRKIEIDQPLDPDLVAMIAVARNPELRAARARAKISRAEAFSAGLLPNPQFSSDYGVVSSGPGTVASFTLGLMQDVTPFLTLSSRQDQGEALVRGTDLDLLWQEWQVISQARLLTVRVVGLEKQQAMLETNRKFFATRYEEGKRAMARGDQTLLTVISDLAALNALTSQLYDLQSQGLAARLELNELLGLTANASLNLASDFVLPPLDKAQITASLDHLPQRRPDLLALQAGYAAQEESVYQAILLQFPALSVGGNRASDNSNIKTNTASISVSLPLFNHNQGAISVERATRLGLKLDYQARLDAAQSGVMQALRSIALLQRQLDDCRVSLATLRGAAQDADLAFKSGGLDERSFADLQAALLARRMDEARLDQSLAEQRVQLATLIGGEIALPPQEENDE